MIYLDNGASTYKKPKEVVNKINFAMKNLTANPGRSGHKSSMNAFFEVNRVREKICEFFGAYKSENVVFTSGCTEALNLAILGNLKENSHIIVTANEHNSVLRPIFTLKEKYNLDITVVYPKLKSKLTQDDIITHIKPTTSLICTNHISNVDGMEAEISSIGELCQEKCIPYLVDCAQSAGHKKIDMRKSGIDLLAIAGHKGLYGPQGVGALCFSPRAKPNPIKFGGTGTESISLKQPSISPECYESGTIQTPNIIGLGAGIDFVQKNFYDIQKKDEDFTTYINFELRKIPNVKVYTHKDNANGVLSFNIGNVDSSIISSILDEKYNIATRSGLHCAPLKHKSLGTTAQGTVRVSLSYFNTFTEIEHFIKAVKHISKNF